MRRIKVPILTEEYSVMVFIGKKDELIKEAKKYTGWDADFIREKFGRGVTLNCLPKTHPLILLDGDLHVGLAIATLAHEALHAVEFIADYVGISDSSGEFRGHGIAAIMRQCAHLFTKKL